MKNACVTLVEPKQIAKKGYQGCKSTKTVVQFARKYGVPTLWWKPTNGQKVLLIEPTQFGQTWKQVQGGKTGNKTARAHASNTTNTAKKTNTMWKRTTGTNAGSAWGGTSTRSTAKKNGTTRSTAYGKNRASNTTNKTSSIGTYGRTTSGNKTRKMMGTAKRLTMGKTTARRTTKTTYRRAA